MSTFYEGTINRETTPQAFALVESWNAKLEALHALPELDQASYLNAMQAQQKDLMLAIGRIEHAINMHLKEVITA